MDIVGLISQKHLLLLLLVLSTVIIQLKTLRLIFIQHSYVVCIRMFPRLPNHVTLEEGVLLEPLAVGVHACKKAGVTGGSTVLILGAGPIGLVTLASAKAMGASKIFITDLTDYRLSIAKDMGAFKTIKVCKRVSDEEAIKNVQNKMDNERVNITIDCTGFQQTMKMGIEVIINSRLYYLMGRVRMSMSFAYFFLLVVHTTLQTQ